MARSANGAYGGAVEMVDWVTDVILRELRALGIDEDTIVVFTSDNGSRAQDGGSNAPLRGTKGSTWDGGQRVPCIVRWPGHVAPGRTSDELVASIDLFATLASLCGATLPADRAIDGVDVSDLLLDGAPSARDAFWFYWMNDLEAVRAGRWKLHVAKSGAEHTALYDVVADPGETTDRAAEEPAVVAELMALADAARASLGDARLGIAGAERRPLGRVTDARPLTVYDPTYPYYAAEYDLADRG